MIYSVKDLAEFSGVSIRTLHYYDKIGLLTPAKRTKAGYCNYGDPELLRLQQILFYKELDFSLKEIADLLDEPSFDLIKALENHRRALRKKRSRLSTLLKTIDQTIHHLKKGMNMEKPEMLYEGLPKEVGTTYRQEAIKKYGKQAIDKSEKTLMALGKEGFKQLQKNAEEVNNELFTRRNQSPTNADIQSLIARHYLIIRKFWGTEDSQDKQGEAYCGLGQLYVDDERFTQRNGQAQPEFAIFLRDAMTYYAENNL